jgi:hypothetical protein
MPQQTAVSQSRSEFGDHHVARRQHNHIGLDAPFRCPVTRGAQRYLKASRPPDTRQRAPQLTAADDEHTTHPSAP